MVGVLATSMVLVTPLAGASTKHAPVHMPNVVGLTRSQVYAVMHRDALYFTTKGARNAKGGWVSVAGQSPRPGTLVAWHTTVTLTISLAPYRGPRAVPRLVGLSRAQVYAAMRKAQLFFTTRGAGSSNGTWVIVVGQSPRPGVKVRWHSTVLLTTSRTRPPTTTTTLKRTVKPKPKPKPVVTTTSPPTTTSTSSTTTTTYLGETTTTGPSTTTTTTIRTTTTVHTTTTTLKRAAVRYRVGVATWYNYIPGRCATWYLPIGTRVTVRDLGNGRVIRCVVSDREAAHGNRVVDLSETQFAQLAPLAKGVVSVKVSW